MSFGERLRIARERCGMTQLQVAERMKIDNSCLLADMKPGRGSQTYKKLNVV